MIIRYPLLIVFLAIGSVRCHGYCPSHNMDRGRNKPQRLYKIPDKSEYYESPEELTYTGPDTPAANWYIDALSDLIDIMVGKAWINNYTESDTPAARWGIGIGGVVDLINIVERGIDTESKANNAINLAIFSAHNRIREVQWMLGAGAEPNTIIYTMPGFACIYKNDNLYIKRWLKKRKYFPIAHGPEGQKTFICKTFEYNTVKKLFNRNKEEIKFEFCPQVWREIAPFTAPSGTLAIQTGKNNFFILQHAIERNYIAITKNLMMKGAITNLVYPDGKTLLHVAVRNNNVEIIQTLVLYAPIPLNLEDKAGQRALDWNLVDEYNKNKQAIEFLYKHGARFSKNISKQESKRVTNFRQRCIEKNIQKSCANCDKESTTADKLKQCSSCKCVYYCSKHCQKVHWKKIHSKDCKFTCTHCKRFFPTWGKTSIHHSLIDLKRPCCSRKKCMKKDLVLGSNQASLGNQVALKNISKE